MVFQEKKKEIENRRRRRRASGFVLTCFVFFCHSPCGDSHPGEVTHLRPEPKETADVRN